MISYHTGREYFLAFRHDKAEQKKVNIHKSNSKNEIEMATTTSATEGKKGKAKNSQHS